MTTHHHDAWIEVFSGPAFEAEVIRGMLKANGIRCIIEDHTSVFTAPKDAHALTLSRS